LTDRLLLIGVQLQSKLDRPFELTSVRCPFCANARGHAEYELMARTSNDAYSIRKRDQILRARFKEFIA